MNINKKGFTLIELLVVIAIIGILASVVLASLNSARSRGSDAAIKANLANARAQAELYYETSTGGVNSYGDVCDAASTGGIRNLVTAAATQASGIILASPGTALTSGGSPVTWTNAVCNNSAGGWVAAVPLRSDPVKAYCVDWTGDSRELVAGEDTLAATDYTCGS